MFKHDGTMNIHPSHRNEATHYLRIVAALAALMLLVWLVPTPTRMSGIAHYIPFHNALETVGICIAGLIFAVGWNAHSQKLSRNILLLACTFIGVAILDFLHMSTFRGMPDFFTQNEEAKSINFWLAARTFAAVALLSVAVMPWHLPPTRHRGFILGTVLLLVFACYVTFMYFAQYVPVMYVRGEGLTTVKIIYEYGLIAAYLCAAALFFRQMGQPRTFNVTGLFATACVVAMSEFFFTLYSEVTDVYNMVGHLYKIAAYLFLYRALFVETIRYPYSQLQASRAQLRATLDALPDLLLEMNSRGDYLEVHTKTSNPMTYPVIDLVGKNVRDVLSPQAVNTCVAALRLATELGVTRGHRIGMDLPDGHHWFEMSVARKEAEKNQAMRFLVIARDITELVKHEMAIEREAMLNKALLNLQVQFDSRDEQSFLQYGIAFAENITRSKASFIYFADHDQKTVELASPSGTPQDDQTQATTITHIPIGPGTIWNDAFDAGQAIVQNDGTQIGPCRDNLLPAAPIDRLLTVPVLDGNRVCMLAGVANKQTPYTDSDRESVQLIADAIWRIANKRRMNATVSKLSLAVEQSPNSILITDLQANIEYANQAFQDTSGYSLPELLGKNPRILHANKNPATTYVEMWAKLSRGEPWEGELINQKKNGQHYTERVLIYPVRNDQGVVTNYLAHKEDITAKKAADQRINQLSLYDQLTGLPNRALMETMLKHSIDLARHHHEVLTLMWLNIDNFKQINDSLSHKTGDNLLQQLAERLRRLLRDKDTLARVSGDNFVVILPGMDQNECSQLALRILDAIDQPAVVDNQRLTVTGSIGIALYPNDGDTVSALLRSGEAAMYRMKQEGRNGYRFFTPDLQKHSARVLALGASLKQALGKNEFRLVYQPQCQLASNMIVGAEALIRWHHPQFGEIGPAEFIPIAENYGLIVRIGEWVLRTALTQMKQWQEAGLPPMTIAINLSPIQFAQHDVANSIMRLVREAGVAPELLEIELTEATAMKNPEEANRIMRELRQFGFRISIDDFGTGYSSLSYLKRFNVDKLKIDQSFVRDVGTRIDDQAIVNAIIQMSHSLGLTTIAEGVETLEQRAYLNANGCDQIQGYLYSHPLTPAKFEAFVRTRLDMPHQERASDTRI